MLHAVADGDLAQRVAGPDGVLLGLRAHGGQAVGGVGGGGQDRPAGGVLGQQLAERLGGAGGNSGSGGGLTGARDAPKRRAIVL